MIPDVLFREGIPDVIRYVGADEDAKKSFDQFQRNFERFALGFFAESQFLKLPISALKDMDIKTPTFFHYRDISETLHFLSPKVLKLISTHTRHNPIVASMIFAGLGKFQGGWNAQDPIKV